MPGLASTPGRVQVAIGALCLAVVAAGTGVALTRGSVPLRQAPTTLSGVSGAVVIASGGVTAPAHNGQSIASGDVVRTSAGGSAILTTRSRSVWLSGAAADMVVDGSRQQLLAGTAVVDAIGGAPLSLAVAGDSLAVPRGSATRVVRSVSVQVASLAGAATLSNTSGRQVTIAALRQLEVSGDALPSTTTPLTLTDSPAEAHAVPALVDADLTLITLARGIDSTGGASAHAVQTSWTGQTVAVPGGRAAAVLPIVMADATHVLTGAQARYDLVVTGRSQGGSWGVLLAMLDGSSAAVLSRYDALSASLPAGVVTQQVATPTGTGTGHRRHHVPQGGGTVGGGSGGSGGGTGSGGGSTGGTGGGTGSGGGTALPIPTPTPSTLLGTIKTTLNGLLSTPSATPTSGSTGLLGGLLGN